MEKERNFDKEASLLGGVGVMLQVQGWGIYRTSTSVKRMHCEAVQAAIRKGRATSEKALGARCRTAYYTSGERKTLIKEEGNISHRRTQPERVNRSK